MHHNPDPVGLRGGGTGQEEEIAVRSSAGEGDARHDHRRSRSAGDALHVVGEP